MRHDVSFLLCPDVEMSVLLLFLHDQNQDAFLSTPSFYTEFTTVIITCGDPIMPLLFAAPTALRLLLLNYSSTHR